MEQWQIEAEKAKTKKAKIEHLKNIPGGEYLGKTVCRMGEYGVVIMIDDEPFIRYDNKKKEDAEGLYGLPFDEAPSYVLKYINTDGSLKN